MPDLLLAIKETVDSDPRPGRFLLAGSARLLGLRGLPDIVPGGWSRNLHARAVSAPQVAVVDSGIAANLLDLDAGSLREPTGHLGALLEGFVAMELSRQLT
ncbi:MAG: DUF4143 domain-containing protein [Mycobacteriales bacterium]